VVVQRELELINRILDRHAIEVIEGHGRVADPHPIVMAGRNGRERLRVQGEVVVIATGASELIHTGQAFLRNRADAW
jgi:pyruvate/2-oxoglutarate dehydrogenase complex dihydrolipoamide dehydrogenase (E3) component